MLRNFSISQRIVFFVIIMIAMIISTAAVSVRMTEGIIGDGTALAKEMLLDAQKARIKDITHSQALGLSALVAGQAEEEQLRTIAQYVDKVRFENDNSGYFYVYKGTVNAAHPTQKQLVGKDLANTADSRGVRYVSELGKAAQAGGGTTEASRRRASSVSRSSFSRPDESPFASATAIPFATISASPSSAAGRLPSRASR